MKKTLYWGGCVLAVPVILFVLLTVLLYIPPVQQFVARKATQSAASLLDMDVQIGRVRITPFFDFSIDDFVALQGKDTVLKVTRLVADVPFRPLMSGRVDVDKLKLNDAKVNTLQLIESAKISGTLDYLALDSRGILLKEQQVKVQQVELKKADLQVLLRDSVPEDTTSQPTPWKIDLQKVAISDTHLQLLMDSMDIQVGVGKGQVEDLHMNLAESLYQVAQANLSNSAFSMDMNDARPTAGFDYAHIVLDSIDLDAKSILSQGSNFSVEVVRAQMKERSGLRLTSLSGLLQMDSLSLHAKQLRLTTPFSAVALDADVDTHALDTEKSDGQLNVKLNATLGREDLLLAVGPTKAKELKELYPDRDLTAQVNLRGNMQRLTLENTNVQLRDAVSAEFNGVVDNPLNDDSRNGSIHMNARTQNLDFLLSILGLKDYSIPRGMTAMGTATFNGTRYGYNGTVRQGKGLVKMNGSYDTRTDRYAADLRVDSLNLHEFMPKDSIYFFSGDLTAQGRGTDFYAKHAEANVQASVRQLQYGVHEFDGINAGVQLQNHLLSGNITTDNRYLQLMGNIDGYVEKDSLRGVLDVNVSMLDLQKLEVAKDSMVWAFRFNAEAQTNGQDSIGAKASLTDVRVATRKRMFTPKNLYTELLLQPDSVFAHAEAGDFYLDIQTQEGVDTLMCRIDTLQSLFKAQMERKRFSVQEVQSAWPRACIKMRSGNDNPVSNYFAYQGYAFKKLNLHFDVSPEEGLDGDLDIYSMRVDSILLDTIKFVVEQQDTVLRFNGKIRNNRHNPQFIFNAQTTGRLMTDGAMARLYLYDAKNKLAIDLATRARFVEDGLRFTFHPSQPVLAYQTYNLNNDAHVLWRDDGKIVGDMSLLTHDGMGLVFKAAPDEMQQQDMKLEFREVDLDRITSVLPYVPHISGVLNGNLFASQLIDEPLQANGTLKFKDLAYEESPMGKDIEVALNFEPKDENVYQLVGTLRRNGEFVSTVGGEYNGQTGAMDVETILYRFPAEMVNGFIPDHMAGMRGFMEGNFHIDGTTASPLINGTLKTDSVYLYSDMYAVNLRLEDHSMEIKDSRLSLRNVNLLSEKNDKMTLNGTVDFSDLERIMLNLSLRTTNFQVFDKPRNSQTLVYGKAYVTANATVSGMLDELKMRGTVNLLGTSDMTYVLKDSPLTVEDRLSDLVTFVDFNDTILVAREVAKKDIAGVDASLTLQIDEGAKVSCDLSNNRESYVDLIGGGTLVLRYTPEGKMLLTGRYTINSGEMKYALPVIPLKTFSLGSGSYVEFTGDVMNPRLNIAATERTRASVSNGEGAGARTVDFNVGVLITNTMNDMGLEFTIDAPEDMSVQNELASFSKETKGKLAVTMLATGLYMAETNTTGGLSMSSAFNSFLQSEISSIAGNALQSIDVSFGMEDGTSRDGRTTTDYSFRFAKRLWGNRVSIIIGGKVSSGTHVDNGSFIDDISLEYRLDNSGTRYVRLFHEKTFDSLLDGEVLETGAGVVLRKKMTRLGELFIFKNSVQRDRINQNRERRRERAVEERQGERRDEIQEQQRRRANQQLEKAEVNQEVQNEKMEKKEN